MYKLDLEKTEEPEFKLWTSVGSLKKQENSIETSASVSLTMLKPFTVWIKINCGKLLKKWEYQTTWSASCEICVQGKKHQLEWDIKQQTDFKLAKEYIRAVYSHAAYLTYMQSTSWETLGWLKHKLESRLLGEISITSDMQMTPPIWQKEKRNWRASWWRWNRRVKKRAWNSAFKKRRSWHPVPSLHGKRWGNNGNSNRLYFLGLQNHCR